MGEYMLEKLNAKNTDFQVQHITDVRFQKYGRIIPNESYKNLIQYIDLLSVPESGNQYVADEPLLFQIGEESNANDIFGGMTLQYGFVNGNNSKVNSLEYHKTSEINIAVTPLVLFLGKTDDIQQNVYDTKNLEAFYLPKNTVIELYANTLHFSPCKVLDEGFKCGVILPKGTNVDFKKSIHHLNEEDPFLFKTNKWLLAHQEHQAFVLQGAKIGLTGKNYVLKY
jgi:hypothetical protein